MLVYQGAIAFKLWTGVERGRRGDAAGAGSGVWGVRVICRRGSAFAGLAAGRGYPLCKSLPSICRLLSARRSTALLVFQAQPDGTLICK